MVCHPYYIILLEDGIPTGLGLTLTGLVDGLVGGLVDGQWMGSGWVVDSPAPP
jgi:hypothetical protein